MQDVARLHVPVYQPATMRRLQGGGNADGDAHRVIGLESRALAQQRGQVVALDQLHDDVLGAIGIGAVVVDRHDVRVLQRSGGARLLLEAGGEARVVAVLLAQELDGHLAIELLVDGAPDGRHAALAERGDQPVSAADELPDHLHERPFSAAPDRRLAGGVSLAGPARARRRGTRRRPPTPVPWRHSPSASQCGCRHRGARPRTGSRRPAARRSAARMASVSWISPPAPRGVVSSMPKIFGVST